MICLPRNLYAGQKQQLEPDMEQWIGSKLGKEYVKAVYYHSAYLTLKENALCPVQGSDPQQQAAAVPMEAVLVSQNMGNPGWA